MRRQIIAMAALGLPALLASAGPAGACGGLVGENGTIQLVRTTTLAAAVSLALATGGLALEANATTSPDAAKAVASQSTTICFNSFNRP